MGTDNKDGNDGKIPWRRPPLRERLKTVANIYFDELMKVPRDSWPSDERIGWDILSDMQKHIRDANAGAGKGDIRDVMVQAIPPSLVAEIVLRVHRFVMVDFIGGDKDMKSSVLAMYMEDGPFAGTYTISEIVMRDVIRQFSNDISKTDMWNVIDILKKRSPVAEPCRDVRYIALNNGIWDDAEKQLLPFTPDLVFTSKITVDYNPYAADIPIQEPDGSLWTVEGWFSSINSRKENVSFLWDVLAMSVRPNRCHRKVVFLYSDKGNNGKGTYCQLVKNLLGKGNYAGIGIADFGKSFALSRLPYVQAIIADENSVGGFIEDVSAMKALVTGDDIQIDRKYCDPITIKFYGIVIQCINGFPKFRDQSGSLLRRIAMIEMDQCFTGKEKPYIKGDYLGRKEVLEYILRKLLWMDVTDDTMRVPDGSNDLLLAYREYNDPVFEFWCEFKDEFVWDLLPFSFLYDLFKQWFKKKHPSGKVMSYRQFIQNLRASADATGGWDTGVYVSVKPGNRMDNPEHLIIDWDLEDWVNATYSGNDWRLKVSFPKRVNYKGLVRSN